MATLIGTEPRDMAAERRGGTPWRYAPHADVPAAGPISVPYVNLHRGTPRNPICRAFC